MRLDPGRFQILMSLLLSVVVTASTAAAAAQSASAGEFLIPTGTDLSGYRSILVHCEQYSVLWGGGDL